MTIKLTTNTYQKFDELENMNVSYGFSHYVLGKDSIDYVRLTKENSLAVRLIEKVSHFIKLDEQQKSLNQTLAQAVGEKKLMLYHLKPLILFTHFI